MTALGPGRVETFFVSQHLPQPGALGLEATF